MPMEVLLDCVPVVPPWAQKRPVVQRQVVGRTAYLLIQPLQHVTQDHRQILALRCSHSAECAAVKLRQYAHLKRKARRERSKRHKIPVFANQPLPALQLLLEHVAVYAAFLQSKVVAAIMSFAFTARGVIGSAINCEIEWLMVCAPAPSPWLLKIKT